jgi:hypothetical protein
VLFLCYTSNRGISASTGVFIWLTELMVSNKLCQACPSNG